jgi:hypothetical protein
VARLLLLLLLLLLLVLPAAPPCCRKNKVRSSAPARLFEFVIIILTVVTIAKTRQ